MNKKYNDSNTRCTLTCSDPNNILHRIDDDSYYEIRQASVPAADVDLWEEIPLANVPRYCAAQYRERVVTLIRERYDINKEMQLQREMLNAILNPSAMTLEANDDTDTPEADTTTNPIEAFNIYNAYVEQCKLRAMEELGAIHNS